MSRSGENAPPPDGWACHPRACPFTGCDVCSAREVDGFGVYPLPESIVLGEN